MTEETEPKKNSSSRGTILIVEDVHYMRLLLRQTLKSMGYEVIEARDGGQAGEVFAEKQSEIKLVMTDIVMPGVDGIGAIKRIRAIDKKIPILVVTANPNKDNLVACAKLGISGFISKPFDRNRFRAKVLEILSPSEVPPPEESTKNQQE